MLGSSHRYTVLTVAGTVPPRAAAVLDKAIVQAHYAQECERVFKPIRTFFSKHGIDAAFVGKSGVAGDVIAATARAGKFDLLIMGSHGHGAIARLVLGSVASRVLASCETPLLILR